MPRAKRFLILILVLILVNAIFFLAWYGFGLRNYFRMQVAAQLGKLLDGKVSIGELHFSDRQLLAEGLSYTSADSSITVDVARLRVQYNLTSFMLSGFKTSRLIKDIEVFKPVVQYRYIYKPSVPQPSKPLILPDIASYFRSGRIRDGSVIFGMALPLKIIQDGALEIEEELHGLNVNIQNRVVSKITLQGTLGNNGKLAANGILNRGRIEVINAEISAFKPTKVFHPDLKSVRSEISLIAKLSQDSLGSRLHYAAEAQLWGTEALFADNYPSKVPYLWAKINDNELSARISESSFGSSRVQAEAKISDLGPNLKFDFADAKANLDLSMITPDLSGRVNVSVTGDGSIDKPMLSISVASDLVSYLTHSIQNLSLEGEYDLDELLFRIPDLRYENQLVSLSGRFNPFLMNLDAHLETTPLDAAYEDYRATANLDIYAELLDTYPFVDVKVNKIDFGSGYAKLNNVTGYVKLMPFATNNNYYVDAKLQGDGGYKLSVVGDLLDLNLLIDAEFSKLFPALIYKDPNLEKINPELSGSITAIMTGSNITTHTKLEVDLHEFMPYTTSLDALGSFNIKSLEGTLHLQGTNGILNNQPLDFSLAAHLLDNRLKIYGMRVNDFLSLSGSLNLNKIEDFSVSLALWDISYLDIVRFYPPLDASLPEFNSLSLFADYNYNNSGRIEAKLSLADIDLLAITPLTVQLGLSGPPTGVSVAGFIDSPQQKILDLSGKIGILPQLDVSIDAFFHDLSIQKVMLNSPVFGSISGKAGVVLRNLLNNNPQMELLADLQTNNLQIENFTINTARIKAVQYPNKLQVDNLYVLSDQLFSLEGSGALDYNVTSNEFFEGSNRLNLSLDGQLFTWLKNLTPFIQESRGNSSLSVSVGAGEDQFLVSGGKLEISDGFMRLKDQIEPLTDINIKGSFDKNRLIIERGQVQMGSGKLVFNNIFEADNSDHFMLGFLDLGIMRLIVEEPGIQASIPMFTTPKTLTNIVLKGRGSRYAMVKGPFDQMKISAEVILSNTNALFPPNTDNLLRLANTVRETAMRRSEDDMVPLPFTLDVLLTLGDNVKYVTYPAKLSMQPGGYLHLLYDGQAFTVQDAYFSSERGTIDIFGTVFQVDKVDITMVDSQDLLNIDGIFYKRAPDGTMISLKAITSPDLSKSFMDRLEFSLTSDNPEDRTISQILSRLRYSGSSEPNQRDQNGQLQDEALTLISGNLDASLLTPFFSPMETYVRRKLKLDNFSINAGFLQNLYTQYSNDPNQLADYTDMKQFTTDIAQFSSSILLNNLSISASKYLGRRLFLDYELELQEATDLQKRTRLMVSHGTSIRMMLPKQYRLGYTFKYTPQDEQLTHELMLQRSFRFWGF